MAEERIRGEGTRTTRKGRSQSQRYSKFTGSLGIQICSCFLSKNSPRLGSLLLPWDLRGEGAYRARVKLLKEPRTGRTMTIKQVSNTRSDGLKIEVIVTSDNFRNGWLLAFAWRCWC